ncbi:hypothetical protein G6F43_004942 [Rhizopus delemar]|nr:hypothetical protein G6F43_004942 [Rhizopus delemar]
MAKKGKETPKENSKKSEQKRKLVDTSEIDDIFNTKKIASKTSKEEPATKKRKADKNNTSESKSTKNESSDESESEEEQVTEEDTKKVQEVVFAELAAVKNSNKNNQKRPIIPPSDDSFGDSRGLKKTNRTTEEGYPLYDVKDLNIGLGKDTPECPFDCQCCF